MTREDFEARLSDGLRPHELLRLLADASEAIRAADKTDARETRRAIRLHLAYACALQQLAAEAARTVPGALAELAELEEMARTN